MPPLIPTLLYRSESDATLPVLVWRFPRPVQAIASGPLGGGAGRRRWIINATVGGSYARMDPDSHLREIARGLDLDGPGVGMLTAVDVRRAVTAEDEGAMVVATVGLGHPIWAAGHDQGSVDRAVRDGAAPAGAEPTAAGTINIVAWIPAPMSPAALVNAVATATEAKAQALWDSGVKATGTASDAICVATAVDDGATPVEPFGGPRSIWGARLARAVHRTILAGTR